MRSSTLPSSLRRLLAAGAVGVMLVGGLTSCSNSPGDTTCGEVRDMDTDERIDLIQEGLEEEGDDEDLQAFEDAPDEAKEAGAEALVAACEGEDDDTKLDDIEGL